MSICRLNGLFSPYNVRKDGTVVFASPAGLTGSFPLIALEDLGWWVRYIFDNVATTTGKNIKIASQVATFPEIVEAYTRVTGKRAEYKPRKIEVRTG